MDKTLYIYFDDVSCPQPLLVGQLSAQNLRGKEVFAFEFSDLWLKQRTGRPLDPDLQLYAGRQFLQTEKSNFGIFLDSSPDRWGRVLLDRREAIRAKDSNRQPQTLQESDYLLGVYDECRMGALRIKSSPDGGFLDNDPDFSTPPLASLGELEHASWRLERDTDADTRQWLRIILAPGSSLGGARPKANIKTADGHLWIAKFPSRHDKHDIGAWETVAMTLARRCGIRVAPFESRRLNGTHHTFLTRRFDRDEQNKRIHFSSAMTMLGYTDGETAGCSYLELAEWISRYCCDVEENLVEMWRRIVFNIAVSNCDDHLRNHGFLLTAGGWTLSPAYDLNPQADGAGLSLNINEKDNSLDYSLAKEVAPYFGLSATDAGMIIDHTTEVVSSWRTVATRCHISREGQEVMANAFIHQC